MGFFTSNSKTLISKAPERTLEETIKTILSIDETNPSLCNSNIVQRLLHGLGLSHLYKPIEAASFLGAFGESMVFVIQDAFGYRYILKLCIAEYRDYVPCFGKDGGIESKRISSTDKKVFVQRFLGGIKNQIDAEKLLSTEIFGTQHKYGIPRVQLFCTNPIFVVMEYIEGIDIIQYAKTLNNVLDRVKLIFPLLDFVDKLDSLGKLHRDLKSGNIIISTPRGTNKNIPVPYLLDWGQSKIQKMRALTSPICGYGSIPYTSPQCGPLGDYAKATVKDDIYSLGILFWEILTQKHMSRDIASSDYGDENFMARFHKERSLDLDIQLRLPYLIATSFNPSKRFCSAADFRRMVEQSVTIMQQGEAALRIHKMEDMPLGGRSAVADCTSFIDVTVNEDDQKQVIIDSNKYVPRKVLKTMNTMPIELITDGDPLTPAINLMLSAVDKARRRSK